MKKFMTLLLALVMALTTLTACGGEAPTAKVIDISLTEELYAFAVDKNQPELLEATNNFIKKIKEDGTLEAINNKYFGDGTPEAVVSAELDETKDQLVIATNAAFPPFEYTDDGGKTYYGIDMEIMSLFAKELGKELVIVDIDFDAVLLYVQQGKCDMGVSGLTITEARKEMVDFTESYYNASQKLIVLSDNTEFDACKTVEDVEKILNSKDKSYKMAAQKGTTGSFYITGDEDWGFTGFPVEYVEMANGSLAVQDLLNGGLDCVVIDSAPAASIVESFNSPD